jgi:hypothetical protein
MKLTKSQTKVLRQIELGAQRLRRDPDFAMHSRGFAPLSLRELALLSYLAGRW